MRIFVSFRFFLNHLLVLTFFCSRRNVQETIQGVEVYRLKIMSEAHEEATRNIRGEVTAGIALSQPSTLAAIRQTVGQAISVNTRERQLVVEQEQCQKVRDEYLTILRAYENNYRKLRRDIRHCRLPSLEETLVTAALLKSRKSFVNTLTTKMNEF